MPKDREKIIAVKNSPDADIGAASSAGRGRSLIARIAAGAAIAAAAMLIPMPGWAETTLYAAALLLSGCDAAVLAVKKVAGLEIFNERLLIVIACVCAFALGRHYEAVAVMLAFQLSWFLSRSAEESAKWTLGGLVNFITDKANLLVNGRLRGVRAEEIDVGSEIAVNPGETVPLDGVVTDGCSTIDVSHLEGGTAQREILPGDRVFSGSVNRGKRFVLKTETPYAQSAAYRITEILKNAENERCAAEKLAAGLGKYFAPAFVLLALLTAFVPVVFPDAGVGDWAGRAVVILILASPYALAVSVPLTYFSGIGRGVSNGIIFRNTKVMAETVGVKTVVFDNSGTFSRSSYTINGVKAEKIGEQAFLTVAAGVLSSASHPLAPAVSAAAGSAVPKELELVAETLKSGGVRAYFGAYEICAGELEEMRGLGVDVPRYPGEENVLYFSLVSHFLGYIAYTAAEKEDGPKAVSMLRDSGAERIVLFSDDKKEVTERLGRRLHITETYPECRTKDKIAKLDRFSREKHHNWGIALAAGSPGGWAAMKHADIGIAMTDPGSVAEVPSAGILILNQSPTKVAFALNIAKSTCARGWLFFALFVLEKLVLLTLGLTGVAGIWPAAVADAAVSLILTAGAGRLAAR